MHPHGRGDPVPHLPGADADVFLERSVSEVVLLDGNRATAGPLLAALLLAVSLTLAPLGVLHFWWMVKKDITEPAIYAAVLAVLLGVWAFVAVGCGVLFGAWLDQFRIGGFPLGLWFTQQGAMLIFIALIAVYHLWMTRIERAHGVDEAAIADAVQVEDSDWYRACEEACGRTARTAPGTPAERARLQRQLATRGFTTAQIRAALGKNSSERLDSDDA